MNSYPTEMSTSILGSALFADAVIRFLKRGALDFQKEELIGRIDSFIKDIETGNRIVSTGMLEQRAFESMNAYRSTLDFLMLSGKTKTYSKLIKDVKSEIKYLKENNVVDPRKVMQTLELFENIRTNALRNVSRPILE